MATAIRRPSNPTEQLLYDAYLVTFGAFATDPSEVAAELKVNSRAAREALGVLINLNLVVMDRVNDAEDVWQCAQTYDTLSKEQAIQIFWAALDAKVAENGGPTNQAKEATMNTTSNGTGCTCGCGLPTNKSKLYRPGHDAKHVSRLVKATVAGDVTVADALAELPGEALRAKYRAAVENARKPKADKAAKVADVKVGRWSYPARKIAGRLERNTKRDGSGPWVAA